MQQDDGRLGLGEDEEVSGEAARRPAQAVSRALAAAVEGFETGEPDEAERLRVPNYSGSLPRCRRSTGRQGALPEQP